MFKQVSDAVTFVVTANQQLEANKRQLDALFSRVEALSERLTAVAMNLQELRGEFCALAQHQQDEREKQELRFQLALERLERRLALPPLPPPTSEGNSW